MFTKEFTHDGLTTRVTVIQHPAGWELRQESEQGVVRFARYDDWHRVERALNAIGRGQLLNTAQERAR